ARHGLGAAPRRRGGAQRVGAWAGAFGGLSRSLPHAPGRARRDEMRTTFIFVTLASLLSAAVPACALNFFELEVYPATTEGQGLHEVENLTTFVAQGRRPNDEEREGEEPRRHRLLRTTVEYNYGLTDKIDVAAYTDLERLNGDALEYAGSRVRARGGLFEKGRFPLDLGWYIEAEMPHRGESDLEIEFRPIVSRDFGRFSIDLNPSFELPTVSEERRTLAFNYGARVYYRLSPTFVPGIESFAHVGGLVAPAAVRHRGQVRRVGLDQQAVAGHGADRGAQRVGVLEGDDAGHGDVEAEVQVAPRVVASAGEAVDDAAHRCGALGA